MDDMSRRADEYVQHVRDEAAKIVQQAHRDAAEIRKQAEEAGRAAAESAIDQVLATRVGKQIDTLRPAVNKVVQQLESARGAWMDHWQSAAVTLAAQIAEHLVRRELTSQPDISEQWVREALSLTTGRGQMTLRLCPLDHQHLAPRVEELVATLGKIADAKIVADDAITPGGCVVETEYGEVDMRLESQIQRVLEELS